MEDNKRIDQLEKRVSELEKQVAAVTTTYVNPQEIAKSLENRKKNVIRKRGVAY